MASSGFSLPQRQAVQLIELQGSDAMSPSEDGPDHLAPPVLLLRYVTPNRSTSTMRSTVRKSVFAGKYNTTDCIPPYRGAPAVVRCTR